MEELRRQDEENRPKLEEQRRRDEILRQQKEFVEEVRNWKLARDIQEFVWTTHEIIAEAGMQLADDAPLGNGLRCALEYADDIDLHTSLRDDIAMTKAAAGVNTGTGAARSPNSSSDAELENSATTTDIEEPENG